MSDKYSYSKLDTYKSCPFKFKLQYIDGNYVYAGSIATEFGTAIHEAEESIAKSIQAKEVINYIEIKNTFINKIVNIEAKYPKDFNTRDSKTSRTYKDKAYEYLTQNIYNLEKFMNNNPDLEIVGIEQKFNFVYDENHTFTGAIDRVFHNKKTDRYLIQDIKSWAVPKDKKELTTPLQFVIYSLAAKELWGADPEQIKCQYYLPLVDDGITQDGGTTGFMTRGVDKLISIFNSISKEDYKPNRSPLCNYCNFCQTNPDAPTQSKYLCPYYSLWNRDTRIYSDISKHENEWKGIDRHQLILEAYHKKYNINVNLTVTPDK